MSSEVQVSVIVPSYEHVSYVAEAVRSALAQGGVSLEVIAIDDGSRDDSLEVLRAIEDPRLVVLAQENRGLSRTLNRGLARARGQYVKMLPSDDALVPGALARQVAVAASEQLALVFSLPLVVDSGGRPLADPAPQAWFDVEGRDERALLRALVERNPLCAPGALFDRVAAQAVGGFDPSLRVAQDYDLWLRLLPGRRARLLPERLVAVRWHGANQSAVADESTESERAYSLIGAIGRLGLDGLAAYFGTGETEPPAVAERAIALARALLRSNLRETWPFARRLLVEARSLGASLPAASELEPLLRLAPELAREGEWSDVRGGGRSDGAS
ncbi:MAG: glycosyltransferase [Deltaproteobacteria bacterium]|nr:glycosyltransferase [Deltaproteobacteria bacterium]